MIYYVENSHADDFLTVAMYISSNWPVPSRVFINLFIVESY